MRKLQITSFGFRHGQPPAADLVVDLRDLKNPEHDRELRKLRGTDEPVAQEVRQSAGYEKLFHQTKFKAASARSVAVGCKSGHHRAVVLAIDLSQHFKNLGYEVNLTHRDIAVT